MKKEKPHLSPTMATVSEPECKLEEADSIPMDVLNIEVYNLRLYEDDARDYLIKMSFYNREILTEIVKPIYKKDKGSNRPIATGNITYSPANYEEMCVFADYPLIVTIHPYHPINVSTLDETTLQSEVFLQPTIEEEESCCNIDILPLFIDRNEMKIQQTLEPKRKPKILKSKSWNTLPQIDIQISVIRDPLNEVHQVHLEQANFMKVTLIGTYNMLQPYDPEFTYSVVTYMPIKRENVDPLTEKDLESNASIVTFNDGKQMRRKFNFLNFQQKWGTMVTSGGLFSNCDDKMNFSIDNLQNQGDIEIDKYLKPSQYFNTILWKSFHRHIFLGDTATWLAEHICKYKWPLELHLYSENGGFSFMAFLDLFLLLYPGETTVNLAVPLQWINSGEMMNNCGCELLLTPEYGPIIGSETNNSRKMGSIKPSEAASAVSDADIVRHTGFDEGPAFVLVQVHLAKPLKKIVIPTPISQNEIDEMLTACEGRLDKQDTKWSCTGRGHREIMWQQTIDTAAESLRNVPFYGKMEYCLFNRQLSESRTRVELATSFCQDSAIYVNNNFVIGNFLTSDEAYEELVRMSHAHLMKETVKYMLKVDDVPAISPVLRAARHARQLQDLVHAKSLYLQVVTENTKDANNWRELSTCFRDLDKGYASICINQAITLYPRHPLSLLSKAATLFEEDPDGADIFFVAILRLYPFWKIGWVIVSAYYSVREMHHLADEIIKNLMLTIANITPRPPEPDHPRAWERELGDWWDHTPLLPGQTMYYEAADLLLRLRAVSLAEVCVAKALPKDGETPQYVHLVALCCRLRGDHDDAICHLEAGIQKFGNISYLSALLAECRHQKKDCQSVFTELAKAGHGLGQYSTLLSLPGTEPQKVRLIAVELIRRCPSAYAWLALADDWLRRAATGEGGDAGSTDDQNTARNCAVACAVQALKIDRRAGRAWSLLAKLCELSLRRTYYHEMAIACGCEHQKQDLQSMSQQSLCHYVGIALLECQCEMYLKV